MAHPKLSKLKDRSIITIGATAVLLSVPLAAPLATAAADSPFQPLRLEKAQLLDARPVTRPVTRPVARPVAVVDEATGQLVDPKSGTVIDRAKAVIDPATGKLIDPVTGAIIPAGVLAPVQQPPASPAVKPQAAASRKSSAPAGGVVPGDPLPVPAAPANDGVSLLAPADQMVVGVVDEVLGATSNGNLQPLTSLLGERNTSDDTGSAGGATAGSLSKDSTRGHAEASALPVPGDDVRTSGLASGSDTIAMQPSALALSAPGGGTSGVPYLLGALALSGLHSSDSFLPQQDLSPQAPQVSIPAAADADAPSPSVVTGNLTTSERYLATGQVTATSFPGVLDEAPSWLVSTVSGLLLLAGGTSVAYGTRRLRRPTA